MTALHTPDHAIPPTVAAAIGLGFVLLGAALLLQELGLRWSVAVALVMLAVGVQLLVSGLIGAHRTSAPTQESSRTPRHETPAP